MTISKDRGLVGVHSIPSDNDFDEMSRLGNLGKRYGSFLGRGASLLPFIYSMSSLVDSFQELHKQTDGFKNLFLDLDDKKINDFYLRSHSRLPGSNKTKRLRKKRCDFTWKWYYDNY